MKKEKGNVGDLLAAGICILAMTVVMLAYLDNMRLIGQKTEVSQIARKYILRMETVGMLTEEDRTALCEELAAAGVTELGLEGTTLLRVEYGEPILLKIQGKLRGEYAFTENRMSTAKH